jgi:hypothetical protein
MTSLRDLNTNRLVAENYPDAGYAFTQDQDDQHIDPSLLRESMLAGSSPNALEDYCLFPPNSVIEQGSFQVTTYNNLIQHPLGTTEDLNSFSTSQLLPEPLHHDYSQEIHVGDALMVSEEAADLQQRSYPQWQLPSAPELQVDFFLLGPEYPVHDSSNLEVGPPQEWENRYHAAYDAPDAMNWAMNDAIIFRSYSFDEYNETNAIFQHDTAFQISDMQPLGVPHNSEPAPWPSVVELDTDSSRENPLITEGGITQTVPSECEADLVQIDLANDKSNHHINVEDVANTAKPREGQAVACIRPATLLMDNARKNSLGPSRPISLPPSRRGGRKGPLTVRERAMRREARRKGACIRCRRMKEKVDCC